ncbi:Zeta toxin [Roseimaritima multifibrata]|uniref:Zeta toxin n=1 Tax=Roseimaritima multifibrata TaxID=1930274 RepID=A0A517MGI3_9BACT|nr:bifunctional aminoglycoside phosphotransferase/ATP-binding protein [Roseimaritima multifibrata]QDS93976.1 Zeta toxin [Roseimaritima multifibrata]
MPSETSSQSSRTRLLQDLQSDDAYPHPVDQPIEVHETHISIVFLAGDYAYKVKKTIKTSFLDYTTLAKRKTLCEEELRLDRRYAPELYMDVVPICLVDNRLKIGGDGEPVEYAVKMRRFPKEALLSERIETGKVTTEQISQLAATIADFHSTAEICEGEFAAGWADFVTQNLAEILQTLEPVGDATTASTLRVIRTWSQDFQREHASAFRTRTEDHFIRECHGDLHLQNVVNWNGRLIPFDGIEFNKRLRCIDVMSDSAFTAMDLAARGHLDLSRSFINAYFEHTGDYSSIVLLRWYLCYRSIVRALVASIRSSNQGATDEEKRLAKEDCRKHVDLAYRFTLRQAPGLWITHGLSGSGKTTISESVVQRREAIRLRSDIERKRHFGLKPTERPTESQKELLYSEATNRELYERLRTQASQILKAGYSVIVDATFLKQRERERFRQTAEQEGVSFAILECHADIQTLRQRVVDRLAKNSDASDADLEALNHQLATNEPITGAEREFVVDIPDRIQTVETL